MQKIRSLSRDVIEFSCQYWFPAMLFLFTSCVLFTSCGKEAARPAHDNSLLQHKWTINSRTAVFPDNSVLNFTENASADDYLDFRPNDTVYSYLTLYLTFSIDTASYTVASGTITVHDSRQYGIIFQHQNNNGEIQTTTDIEILSLTENMLSLKFPTQGTVNTNGVTTYYPGTIVYNLSR